jgi:hypothetical protein
MPRTPRFACGKLAPGKGSGGSWALLWLGAIAGLTWGALLLAEKLPPSPLAQDPSFTNPLAAKPLGSGGSPPLTPSSRPAPPPRTGGLSHSGTLSLNWVEALRQPRVQISRLNPGDTASPTQPPPRPPISAAMLLGGPLGLESLQEKPMVPAARLEQALRARSADRLDVVPPHWRPAMRALLNGPERVLPAEVVRLPAPHLKAPEEYPLVVKSDGIAETNVTPPPRSKATMERWAKNLTASPAGSARPILVVLEPLALDDTLAENQPTPRSAISESKSESDHQRSGDTQRRLSQP